MENTQKAPPNEYSLGKFVSEYFTPLTRDIQTGVVSDEDTTEIWEVSKEESMKKTRGNKNRDTGTDPLMVDEKEVERSFWLRRPDGWVINRKMKKSLVTDREWEVEVTPLVVGQRSVKESEWLKSLKVLVAGERGMSSF